MPSSPDLAMTVRPWNPVQLGAAGATTGVGGALPFQASGPASPVLNSFQVSGAAGVPDEVLEPTRDAARAAGFAEGWASGLREAARATAQLAEAEVHAVQRAATERRALTEQAFGALNDAAGALELRAVQAAVDIEEHIISAAFEIAQALVGYSLRDDATRGPAAIARALSLAPADQEVTVAVSPADFHLLAGGGSGDVGDPAAAGSERAATGTAIRRQFGRRTVTIVADPALAPGDALATCGATEIDARLATGLARVREVLAS